MRTNAYWTQQTPDRTLRSCVYSLYAACLGEKYRYGDGILPNNKEAAKWYGKVAEQGDATAQASLGMMCDFGEGVKQDYKEAAKWYRLAAEQGSVSAQYYLGGMYEDGLGVPQDLTEATSGIARQLYRAMLARESDSTSCTNSLSLVYVIRERMLVAQKQMNGTDGDCHLDLPSVLQLIRLLNYLCLTSYDIRSYCYDYC